MISRFWCFQKKKEPSPKILTDAKVINPLNLDELPNSLMELRALEGALINYLVSIHYKLEEAKGQVREAFQRGHSVRGKEALAKRVILSEKQKLFEKRLHRVQARIQEIKNS